MTLVLPCSTVQLIELLSILKMLPKNWKVCPAVKTHWSWIELNQPFSRKLTSYFFLPNFFWACFSGAKKLQSTEKTWVIVIVLRTQFSHTVSMQCHCQQCSKYSAWSLCDCSLTSYQPTVIAWVPQIYFLVKKVIKSRKTEIGPFLWVSSLNPHTKRDSVSQRLVVLMFW